MGRATMIRIIDSGEHRLTTEPTQKFVRHLKPGDRISFQYDWYRIKAVVHEKAGKIKLVYGPCDPRKYNRRISNKFDPDRVVWAKLPPFEFVF